MGSGHARAAARLSVCAAAVLAGVVTLAPGSAAAAAGYVAAAPSTSAAGESPIVQAARRLAAVESVLATLRDRIPADRQQVAATSTALSAATDAARTAADQARAAHHEAARAAKAANAATIREQVTAKRAARATADMKRLAREIYINGAGASELALFVGFATDGPAALSAYASRDIALGNAGTDSVHAAERTAQTAVDAAAAADSARAAFDDARSRYRDAASLWADARRSRATAQAAVAQAEQRLTDHTRRLTHAEGVYTNAQEAFDRAAAAGGGGLPASAGNHGPLVWGMLVAAGFSEQAAAGVLGNLQQESNIDPTGIQAGGPGRGMAQWSQGGRWDNGPNSLLAYARANHLKPWDAVTQTKFMIYEMDYGYGGFDLAGFKRMTDVLAATVYFHDHFEQSADSATAVIAVRGGYAQQWYDALHSR